jgi:TRAP-type mannitol/chloroaromatic compound transport system permease large subunit
MILFGISLILIALLGAPLFAVIAASAMFSFHHAEIDLQVIAIEFFGIAELPILLAIPLFTFAGYLLSESGAPQRLVRLTGALLGWMPAGLAIVSLFACAFFTAFTGASGVTIIALVGRKSRPVVRPIAAAHPLWCCGQDINRGPVPGRYSARFSDAGIPFRLQCVEEPRDPCTTG